LNRENTSRRSFGPWFMHTAGDRVMSTTIDRSAVAVSVLRAPNWPSHVSCEDGLHNPPVHAIDKAAATPSQFCREQAPGAQAGKRVDEVRRCLGPPAICEGSGIGDGLHVLSNEPACLDRYLETPGGYSLSETESVRIS
jgi:hypothetical protein